MARLLLLLPLIAALGCGALGQSAWLARLPAIAADAALAVSQIETAADTHFAAAPDAAIERAVELQLEIARQAAMRFLRAETRAERGQHAAEFRRAWAELYRLLEPLGVLSRTLPAKHFGGRPPLVLPLPLILHPET